jgi:hypothetical protein
MQRILVNTFAVVGAVFLMGSSIGWINNRLTAYVVTGRVLGPDDKPLAGLSVFLDRGSNAIERYATDSAGAFRLPLFPRDPHRATWLICPAGAIPIVGRMALDDHTRLTFRSYNSSPATDSVFGFYRAEGWKGPIPRECPRGTDAVGWRYPASSGKDWGAFTLTEPDWARYPGPPAMPSN